MLKRRAGFCLKNKNIILTGASGGLGSALTVLLIERYGCRVLGVGRSEEKLLALRRSLGERADCFSYRVMDVSRRDDWRALGQWVKEGGFDADILVNNAGMLPRFARFGDYRDREITEGLAANWDSVRYAAEEFLPLFVRKDGTAMVNIASADALCPLAGTSVYSAGKAAVMAFSEALREEYRGQVYIPAVCPGFIRTDIMRGQIRAVSPLVNRVSMPPHKAARIILRRINARHSRIVVGADAHFMSLAYRVAPVGSQRLFKWILKVSGLELFADLFV